MMGQRRVACSALAAMLGSVGLKKSTLGSAFCIRMLICKMQISGQVYLDITLSFAYIHEKIHEFRLRHANFGKLGEGHSDHLQSTEIQTQTSVLGKSFETDIVILMNWETQLRRASAEFILKSGLCLWDTSGPPPPVALAHGLFLDASERSFPHFWFRTFHYMKASLADGITNSSPLSSPACLLPPSGPQRAFAGLAPRFTIKGQKASIRRPYVWLDRPPSPIGFRDRVDLDHLHVGATPTLEVNKITKGN